MLMHVRNVYYWEEREKTIEYTILEYIGFYSALFIVKIPKEYKVWRFYDKKYMYAHIPFKNLIPAIPF